MIAGFFSSAEESHVVFYLKNLPAGIEQTRIFIINISIFWAIWVEATSLVSEKAGEVVSDHQRDRLVLDILKHRKQVIILDNNWTPLNSFKFFYISPP